MQIPNGEVERDDRKLHRVIADLKRGRRLAWHTPSRRYFITEGNRLTGPSLSCKLVAELEQEGVLQRISFGLYALKEPSC